MTMLADAQPARFTVDLTPQEAQLLAGAASVVAGRLRTLDPRAIVVDEPGGQGEALAPRDAAASLERAITALLRGAR